jgi:dynein heavy chain
MKQLDTLNKEISEVKELMRELDQKYVTAMNEKMKLQVETQIMLRRLNAANKLISGLSSEHARY